MLYIENTSVNPHYNLALEEYVFNNVDEDCFILWQNQNTIVIGKYQNTIEEIDSGAVKQHEISLVRRMSGGGAVYHDLGNVNFTFVTKKNNHNAFNFKFFTDNIVKMLKKVDVDAEFNSRNDLVIAGRKFSGNSQYIKGEKILHHGTLLFNSNLDMLTKVLNVKQAKIESKAIKSIHERVTNISEHTDAFSDVEAFKKYIAAYMKDAFEMEPYSLTAEGERLVKMLAEKKYSSWNWNYGESPKCDIQKEGSCAGGSLNFHINIEQGCITYFKVDGDFFAADGLAEAEKRFIGLRYSEEELRKAAEKLSDVIQGTEGQWILETILQ